MSQDLKDLSQKIIDKALAKGAEQCEVLSHKARTLSLKADSGSIEEHKISSTSLAGVRLKKDGKIGISYTEKLDDEGQDILIQSALDSAKYKKADEFENILTPGDGKVRDGTCDSTWQEDHSTDEEKVNLALKLESDVLGKDKRIRKSPYNGFREVEAESFLANHLGLFKTVKGRSFSAYTSALAEENGKSALHWHSSTALRFKDLDISECCDVASRHALQLLKGDLIPTKSYPVIFDTDTFSEVFGCFMSVFSAKAAIDKNNPWADLLGKKVATNQLSVLDHPTYAMGLSYQTWDGEGTECQPVDLIKNGVLENFLQNSSTASQMGLTNNARAARSAKGPLGVSSTHMIISKGTQSESELYAGECLEIIGVDGLHSGSEFISGNFSFGASGYLKKDGQVVQVVKGITVSGNFYELLNQIEALGSNLHANSSRDLFAPLIRFEKVSVGGN